MDRRNLVPYVPRLLLEWEFPSSGPHHRSVDASMAFVDISGFTAMSERLARLGKEGAEEVTEIIGSIFTRLLGVAYENGGSLLKFGGDALLLFFTGPSHEVRAAHAAAGMRRGLREIGRIRTSVGVAGLRMHVGIHSGPFDLFVVGETFRDLVIAGPHATRTVEMESAAVAGEIVVSEATAGSLPPSVLGEERAGGRLLVRTPRPPLMRLDLTVQDDDDASPFIPPNLRSLLSGTVAPEHRRVGVAFVRFDGIDALIERDGRGIAADRLHELMCVVHEACDRNGVTYIDNDPERGGGKILLVSGAPTTTERDGEALARAAREILDSAPPLRVRIGLNLGPTFAGPIGPAYRRKYTVMGDTVNLAARLTAHADPGRIVATPVVLERSRATFDVSPIEPFHVKGKRDAVQAFDVGVFVRSDQALTMRTPLIGRDPELQRLRDALDRALAGEGGIVEIIGEPGLGKSRLADEIRTIAAPLATTLHTIAEQYERATPYSAMRDLIRRVLRIDLDATAEEGGARLFDVLSDAAPELLPWMPLIAIAADARVPPTPEVESLGDEFKGERLRHAVIAAAAALLDGPVVVVVEDGHWLDVASAELLGALAAATREHPWLLVVTRRPGDLPALAGMTTDVIELEPLGSADAADIVHALAPGLSLTPQQLSKLGERAGGNPLFLQELALAMRAGEGLDGLPHTVDAVIGARIDHLEYGERLLLRHAAVLGAAFSTDLLVALLEDEDDATTDVSTLASLPDFVTEESPGSWRFRHALIRDVAYEALPYRRRAALHRRAGEAIEARVGGEVNEWSEALCLHFHRAKEFERAWRYALVAADRATDKFAIAEAAEYFRVALDAGRRIHGLDHGTLSSVAESLGDSYERLGSYAEAMDAYRAARTLLRGHPPRTSLFLKEGVLRLRLGQYPQALRWYRRGLRGDTDEPSPTDVELGLAYAGVRYYQGRYADCIAWSERMAAVAERIGDRAGLAHAYSLLYLAHTHLGSDDRHRFRDLALPLYEEIGDLTGQANVLNNLGIDAYYEGEWDRALELYRRSRDVQDRTGNVVFAADTDNNIAEILSDQGRLEEAEKTFRRSLETYRAAGYAMGEAFAIGNLGRIAARAGRADEAIELLEDAAAKQRAIGDERNAAEAEARIAEALVLAGRGREALDRAAAARSALGAFTGSDALLAMLLRVEGYAQMQLGDVAAARGSLERSVEVARGADARYELGLSLKGLAAALTLLGDPETGVAGAEAERVLSGLGVVATPRVPLPVPV